MFGNMFDNEKEQMGRGGRGSPDRGRGRRRGDVYDGGRGRRGGRGGRGRGGNEERGEPRANAPGFVTSAKQLTNSTRRIQRDYDQWISSKQPLVGVSA